MKWYQPIQSWHQRKTSISENGYILVWVPEHPKAFSGGWYYEHVLVVEKIYNRILSKGETIHHIDENKTNNNYYNLFVCYRKQHDKAHRQAA
jgi:hypothetical protein